MKITKEQFLKYEYVLESGRTNMFILSNVEAFTGLRRETIIEIQHRYTELAEKFLFEASRPRK